MGKLVLESPTIIKGAWAPQRFCDYTGMTAAARPYFDKVITYKDFGITMRSSGRRCRIPSISA